MPSDVNFEQELFGELKADRLSVLVQKQEVIVPVSDTETEEQESVGEIGETSQRSLTALLKPKKTQSSALSNTLKSSVAVPVEKQKQNVNGGTIGEQSRPTFMLLDVRTKSEFERYHIRYAVHFDPSTLRRDRIPDALVAAKNRPNQIIIVCAGETVRFVLRSLA
ncbi:MAG: hypothetical protein MHM6MM_006970 [Cercozoa sp. M6MM]